MSKILSFIDGKKVYLIALCAIFYGLYNHWFGLHLSWDDTIPWIMGGAGIGAGRSAIEKVIKLLSAIVGSSSK